MKPVKETIVAFLEEARDDVVSILDNSPHGFLSRMLGVLEVFAAEATARVSGDGRVALLTLAVGDFERYLVAIFSIDEDGNMGRRLLGHLPDDKGEDLVSYLTAGDALWAAASVRPEVLDELADVLTPQGEVVL